MLDTYFTCFKDGCFFYATYEETLEAAHYTFIIRFLLLCVSRFPWFWCSCHVVGFLSGDASYHDPNVSPGGMTVLPAFRTPDGHQNGFWWKCVAHSCIPYPATATHSPHLSHTSVRTFSSARASGLSVVQSNGYMQDG